MKVLDPGHKFFVDVYDNQAAAPNDQSELIIFMKRTGPLYPGNVNAYPGTNCQELLRVLISRLIYLDGQDSCVQNHINLLFARQMLWNFEDRAAKRHGIVEFNIPIEGIEDRPTCMVCGHIVCGGH